VLQEALDLLQTVGVDVQHAGLAAGLHGGGGASGAQTAVSTSPNPSSTFAIESAPAQFTLFDRDGAPFHHAGDGRTHFVPGSSGLKVLDHRTDTVRLANTADFVEYVRLADGLAHIDYLATAFSTNDDIEPGVADAWRLFLCLTQSRKPVVSGAFTAHGVPRMGEMMALFRRDRAALRARSRYPCSRSRPRGCSAMVRIPARISSTASRGGSRLRSCR
jgi:trimethylamine--corrinoid protein Co-methyltransferase